MWRFLKCLVIAIMLVSVSLGIYKLSNKYDMNLIYKNIQWSINTKAVEDAVSFDFDKNNNLYIAFKDSVEIIDSDNRESVLFNDKSLNIYDIACYNNELVVATDNRILIYNLDTMNFKEIIKDIPNKGINFKTNILIHDDDLYVTIGSNTNSGVVDESYRIADKASFEWDVETIPYNKSYAFTNYGDKLKEGEKVKEGILSNASVIKFGLKSNELMTYATGLRNVEGLAFNCEGVLIGIVGGMEDLGVRPVKDDVDYIYEIKEKAWYGWPDFSGGDPITSPRFNDENQQLAFVIKNHPTEVPLGPKYQHDNLNSLKGLDIDIEGGCFPKDTIVFADNKENYIYVLTDNGISKPIVKLDKKSVVEKIRYYKNSFYMLDSKSGCIYRIQGKDNSIMFNLPKEVFIFIILLIITIISLIVYKIKIKKVNK